MLRYLSGFYEKVIPSLSDLLLLLLCPLLSQGTEQLPGLSLTVTHSLLPLTFGLTWSSNVSNLHSCSITPGKQYAKPDHNLIQEAGTVFLRYNSHTMKFTLLKYIIQWGFCVCVSIWKTVQLSPLANSRMFTSPTKEVLYPLAAALQSLLSHPPAAPNNHHLLSVSVDLPVLDTSYKGYHAVWGLLCLASFT